MLTIFFYIDSDSAIVKIKNSEIYLLRLTVIDDSESVRIPTSLTDTRVVTRKGKNESLTDNHST